MALGLALIIIFGLSADYLFKRIKLPGLIGMLIVGVLVGPYVLNFMSPEIFGRFQKNSAHRNFTQGRI
jgi:Kef-type K+ transport system membrane component KefB